MDKKQSTLLHERDVLAALDRRKEASMCAVLNTNTSPTYDLRNDQTWADLINLLRVRTRRFVYSADVACWRGQQEDIIEDVVQETVIRIFERAQRAEHGEALPIYSLERMILRIAHNYMIDMLRRDRRLQRISSECSSKEAFSPNDQQNPFEMAIENVSQEELFMQLAHEIALFPEKRRKALMTDLANRMCLDRELTLLQRAFLTVGIDFQAFQQTLPIDPVERARHTALTSLAYKQVAMVMREYSLCE